MKVNRERKIDQFGKQWEEEIRKLITPKSLAVFTTVIYLFSLIPLLWIAGYNYPSADDYSNAGSCHQVWITTHNIFMTLWQGVLKTAEGWRSWVGYFTSNYFAAVSPAIFGERGYVLVTWMMLGILSFAVPYLFHAVFVKFFHADKFMSHSVSMLVLFASVQCMCPAGRGEAFYWYSGASNYTFLHGMALIFFGLLVSAVCDKGKKRIWDLAAASVLGFLTGGGNQMTALNVAIVLLTAIALLTIGKGWSRCKALCIPMGTFYLGFVLNVAAPGNWVRAGGASGMNPLKAVLVSFYDALDRAMSEWTTWPVIIIMIALIPLYWHMTEKVSFRFPCPLVVLLFGYCLVAAMITPPLFAVGNIEAGRLQALIYMMYILLLALEVGYVTGWARKKWERAQGGNKNMSEGDSNRFSAGSCWCLLGCIAFLTFGSILTIIPEPYYYTFSSAVTDLSNGNARAYGEAMQNRIERYHSGEEGIIEVEPLQVQPDLLFFSDLKEDPADWENAALARYYGLEGVVIRKE